MAGRFVSFLLLLSLVTTVLPVYGQLITKDSDQALIDQILQVVWEPSSLIRMWVGLDQLFNIARSWRGVAKKLASLPFGGDDESHVRIQEPRSMRYHKPSVGSHLDRFRQMYASSSLSPVVAHARENQYSYDALGSHLNSVVADPATSGRLPPSFLFQPQEVFMNRAWAEYFRNMGGVGYSSLLSRENDLKPSSSFKDINIVKPPFRNANGFGFPAPVQDLKNLAPPIQNLNGPGLSQQFPPASNLGLYFSHYMNKLKRVLPFAKPNGLGFPPGLASVNPISAQAPSRTMAQIVQYRNRLAADNALAAKLVDLQRQENRNILLNQNFIKQPDVAQHAKPSSGDPMTQMTPQERLNMLLLFMKTFGSLQTKKVEVLHTLLGSGQENYAGTMNRNDVGPHHLNNFIDRDVLVTSDK